MCRSSPFMGLIRILYTVGCRMGGKMPPHQMASGRAYFFGTPLQPVLFGRMSCFRTPLRSVPFERVPRFRASLQSVGTASE